LQQQLDCMLLGVQCACHMSNNSCQAGAAKLPIQLNETLVLLFKHFRGSTSRSQKLALIEARAHGIQLIARDLDGIMNEAVPRQHGKTRWLSTKPATDRMIANFGNYREYFN